MVAPIVKPIDEWNNMVNDFEIWTPPGIKIIINIEFYFY